MCAIRYETKEKFKSPVSEEEYKKLEAILVEAKAKSEKNDVYWDCKNIDERRELRKKLLYVADKAKLALTVIVVRNSKTHALKLIFPEKGSTASVRRPAQEAQKMILKALREADKPLARADLLKLGISPSSLYTRIKELLDSGLIELEDTRQKGRSRRYVLAEKQEQ